MLWFLLVFAAFGAWLLGYRPAALLVFFFLLTNGFQLFPVSWFETAVGIQKGSDFALVLLFMFLLSRLHFHIQLLRSDGIARTAALFAVFIVAGILYSYLGLHYDLNTILRAARRFFFVLGYFVYRELEVDEIRSVVRALMLVTVLQSVVFLLQLVLGVSILNRQSEEFAALSDRGAVGDWKRLYNIPEYTVLFLFYAMYDDSIKKRYRLISIIILGAALVSTLHRSWLSAFIVSLAFAALFRSKGLWKKLSISFAVLAFAFIPALFPALGERMDSGMEDFTNAVNGGYDTHSNKFDDSFSFRLAHAMERFDYVVTDPKRWMFGMGFLTEDSGESRYLNFSVGWTDKYGTRQIDTADIAWSIMFLWLGFGGTVLYLLYYFRTLVAMWTKRDISVSIAICAYMIMAFIISFTSSVFIDATTFCALGLMSAIVMTEQQQRQRGYDQEVYRILSSSAYPLAPTMALRP